MVSYVLITANTVCVSYWEQPQQPSTTRGWRLKCVDLADRNKITEDVHMEIGRNLVDHVVDLLMPSVMYLNIFQWS